MNEYKYTFNNQLLEVFPEEVFSNKYIVFHGTSNYYSDKIQENGFERGYCPFNKNGVSKLVNLSENPEFKNYDPKNIAGSLRNYLNSNMRLSFTSLSGAAIDFATGISKGGQIIGKIRNVQDILNKVVKENPESDNIIDHSIRDLFSLCDKIGNDSGVIYAVKLPNNLNGITHENLVIYSVNSIPATSIVGKVILPNEIIEINRKSLTKQNKQKLTNGIGKILYQQNEEEE